MLLWHGIFGLNTRLARPKNLQVVEENPIIKIERLGQFVESRIEVALKFSSQGVTVHHATSLAYGGLLHQKLARPLGELNRQHQISFLAFVAEDVGELSGKRPNRLCINLYGAEESSRSIGDVLDQASLFLQHPQLSDLTVPYLNPHYLVRPGGRHPAPVSELRAATASETSLNVSIGQQLKNNVFEALDHSAQSPAQYLQILPSPSIRTALKS